MTEASRSEIPFEEIDFPEIHRRAMERRIKICSTPDGTENSANVTSIKDEKPEDIGMFEIELRSELEKALRMVGCNVKALFWRLEELPSLLDPEKYGEELMASREKARELLERKDDRRAPFFKGER